MLFASTNIIHEFSVYDGALYPSFNAMRNIEVFLPLSFSLSLCYQSRSLRQPYASSARVTTRVPGRNMAEAGFIIFIRAILRATACIRLSALKN